MRSAFVDYFKCADFLPNFDLATPLNGQKGYFRFGRDLTCYGHSTVATSPTILGQLADALPEVKTRGNAAALPFDLDEIADNLRFERYVSASTWQQRIQNSPIQDFYYFLRPLFPVSLRKHLQQAYFRDWNEIEFPQWPVDRTVDIVLEKSLALAMKAFGIERIPFIWFWPKGHQAAAIVTHDVETTAGRDFTPTLLDIDKSYGIQASFQVIPERRYVIPDEYIAFIKSRGFEVGIHGLNHDGDLFRHGRELFLERTTRIMEYAKRYGAVGFRSPSMYRNIDWIQDLRFSYDMSVPNNGKLEPQCGGCCTIMPYSLPGGVTELPLTLAQDYTLFHILKEYSMDIWKQQMRILRDAHGLITILTHPDYLIPDHARNLYRQLLEELNRMRQDENVWVALPREVDRWWRQRSLMRLVEIDGNWTIEGSGRENARVAWACLDNGQIVYQMAR